MKYRTAVFVTLVGAIFAYRYTPEYWHFIPLAVVSVLVGHIYHYVKNGTELR